MSLDAWARYIKEREGMDAFSCPEGFAIYKINGIECYLKDIYVYPEHRKSGKASEIADFVGEVAKQAGCKFMRGSVAPQAAGSTDSLKILLSYGFRLLASDNNLVYFVKDLK